MTDTLLMLDLFSGLGGAHQAMKERGWRIVTVDNNPKFEPDYVANILDWKWTGQIPDLIWASPPCTEFAREFMPWSKTGKTPDLNLYYATLNIINETRPRFWIIENVKGAIRYFGAYQQVIGPFYLWGFFPPLGKVSLRDYRKKESRPSSASEKRAKIPYEISLAVALAIERQKCLLPAWGNL